MSKSPISARELVDRLDSRHDELIRQLDELNAKIERALADVYRARGIAGQAASADGMPQDAAPSRRAA